MSMDNCDLPRLLYRFNVFWGFLGYSRFRTIFATVFLIALSSILDGHLDTVLILLKLIDMITI